LNQRKLRKAIYSNVSNGTAGAFNVDPNNAGGPLLNTTSGNVTITSAYSQLRTKLFLWIRVSTTKLLGGSVIIRLG